MPSLDGHSLNEEIKKLRKEVHEELATHRKLFSDLFGYMSKLQEKEVKSYKKKAAKAKKEVANA